MAPSTQRKVLIATPVLLIGGTELQTLSLVRVLIEAGYCVRVCCYYEFDQSIIGQFEKVGAEVILLHLDRSNKMPGCLELWKLMKELISKIIEYQPDIVHVQYVAPGLIPIIAAKLSGIAKVFATVHQPGRPYGMKARLLVRIAATLCNAFFCNSKSVEESWFGDSEIFDDENIDLKRTHFTIYNGIDIQRIEKAIEEANKEEIIESLSIDSKKVIGVVGRLRKEKGQAILLESMKTVIKKIADVVLLVVGDGPDRQYLEEMAREWGIDSHVLWLGEKDSDEVFKLYSVMDVVAIPSIFEGFGLAAVEAMSAGLPVVASRVDGLSEIVADRVTGYLCSTGDSQSMGHALLEILSNPEKAQAMGAIGKEKVQKNFSIEQFQASILSAYYHFTHDITNI